MNSKYLDLITYLENNYHFENLKNYLSTTRNNLSWSIKNDLLRNYLDSFESHKILSLNAIKTFDYRFIPFRLKKIPIKKGKSRKVGIVDINDVFLCRQTFDYLQTKSVKKKKGNVHFISLTIKDKIKSGYVYFLRADIKNFFESLDHSIIIKKLSLYGDEYLTALIVNFIKTPWIWTSKYNNIITVPEENKKGVIPGSAISQGISEIYLQDFDSELENYALKDNDIYIRYCDDICYLSKNRDNVIQVKKAIEEQLSKINLYLNEDKVKYGHIENGFDYLGFHHTYNGIKISFDSITKLKRSITHFYIRMYSFASSDRLFYRHYYEGRVKNWELFTERINSLIRGYSKSWNINNTSFEKLYGIARYLCVVDDFVQIKTIERWMGRLNKHYCFKICELENIPNYSIKLESLLNWYFRYKKDLKKTISLVHSKRKSYNKIISEINELLGNNQDGVSKENNFIENRMNSEERNPDIEGIEDDLETILHDLNNS